MSILKLEVDLTDTTRLLNECTPKMLVLAKQFEVRQTQEPITNISEIISEYVDKMPALRFDFGDTTITMAEFINLNFISMHADKCPKFAELVYHSCWKLYVPTAVEKMVKVLRKVAYGFAPVEYTTCYVKEPDFDMVATNPQKG